MTETETQRDTISRHTPHPLILASKHVTSGISDRLILFVFYHFSTPLHLAVRSDNRVLIEILLDDPRIDCQRQDKEGLVPLWFALQNLVS